MKHTYQPPFCTIIVVNTELLLCTSLSQERTTTLDDLEYGNDYTGTTSADSRNGSTDWDNDLW